MLEEVSILVFSRTLNMYLQSNKPHAALLIENIILFHIIEYIYLQCRTLYLH